MAAHEEAPTAGGAGFSTATTSDEKGMIAHWEAQIDRGLGFQTESTGDKSANLSRGQFMS